MYRAFSRPAPVTTASPGSHLPTFLRIPSSSVMTLDPAARWIAPSTPAPPESRELAAFTMASASIRVMSPSSSRISLPAIDLQRLTLNSTASHSMAHNGPCLCAFCGAQRTLPVRILRRTTDPACAGVRHKKESALMDMRQYRAVSELLSGCGSRYMRLPAAFTWSRPTRLIGACPVGVRPGITTKMLYQAKTRLPPRVLPRGVAHPACGVRDLWHNEKPLQMAIDWFPL